MLVQTTTRKWNEAEMARPRQRGKRPLLMRRTSAGVRQLDGSGRTTAVLGNLGQRWAGRIRHMRLGGACSGSRAGRLSPMVLLVVVRIVYGDMDGLINVVPFMATTKLAETENWNIFAVIS